MVFIKKFNLQYKLMLVFLIVFIIPFIIFSILSYINYKRILEKKTFIHNNDNITYMLNTIDEYFSEIENVVIELSKDSDFMSRIGKQEKNYKKKIDYIKDNEEIYSKLGSILIQNTAISSIYLYTDNQASYFTNFDDNIDLSYFPDGEDWFQKAFQGKSQFLLSPMVDMQTVGKETIVIPYIFPLKNLHEENIAILQFNLNPHFFYNIYERYETNEREIYIINGEGRILYFKDQKLIGSMFNKSILNEIKEKSSNNIIIKDKYSNKKLVSYNTSKKTNLSIILVTFDEELIKDTHNIKTFSILFNIFIILLFFGVSVFLSKNISKPVMKIEKIADRINASHSEFDYQIEFDKEGGLLHDHYNHLILTINNMLKKIGYYNKKEKEQELEILQAQINPHFIYNTLNAIKMVADMQNASEISNALKAFINLMKSSIKIGITCISIEEEVNQIKDYIEIQKLRYYHGFSVNYDIDKEVLNYKTLKFMLQPIVENAIFHGIDTEAENPELTIAIKKVGRIIRYCVKDNGRGINDDIINKLLNKKEQDNLESIGLYNVNKRIKTNFGEDYGIHIESTLGYGTRVSISIPAIFTHKGDVSYDKNFHS